MTWKRMEENQEITVDLKRIQKIPTSEANKLFGLWKFERILLDNREVSDSLNLENNAMLYLAWNYNYQLRNYPIDEKYGIFKTHGHRQRMQMVVNYNAKYKKIEFYDFEFNQDTLHLKSTNKNFELKLTRIRKFLD